MKKISLALISLISLLGGGLAIYGTTAGPWGYTDPVEYLSTGYGIFHGLGPYYYEGNGKLTLISLHPPFYPFAAGIFSLSGANMVAAARWLNILCFVLTIFLAGWIFWRFSRRPGLGVIASALMCLFPWMLVAFTSAYSEPLFIFLVMASATSLLYFLHSGKTAWFMASAVITCLIPMTRYVGIAMIAAGAVVIFLHSHGKSLTRVWKSLLFALISSLPTLLWIVYVYVNENHSIGGRATVLDPATLSAHFQNFRALFMTIVWRWLPFYQAIEKLRYSIKFVSLGLACLIVLVLTILAARKAAKKEATADGLWVFSYFGLSAVFFVIVLAGSYLFTLPTPDVDNRILLPLFVCGVMAVLGAAAAWEEAWLTQRWKWAQVLPWLIAAVYIYPYLSLSSQKLEAYHHGEGLTAYFWNDSSLIQAVRKLSVGTPVISNDWELLYLWTQRPVYGFWGRFPMSQTSRYGSNSADATQVLFCQKGAALVVFSDFSSEYASKGGEMATTEVKNLFTGLTAVGDYSDGSIYRCP